MKIPSIAQALRDARRSFLRFPLVLLDAFCGTLAALILIDHEASPEPTFLFQVLSAAILGFPLLTGLALNAQKRKWSSSLAFGAQMAGVALVALYALFIPQDLPHAPAIYVIRLALLSGGLVLFAFVAPYLNDNDVNGFWHYCKTLLMRLLMAFLYALVLWVGLAIALAALDNLFGIDVPGRRYGELWVFIQGIFTPWFFLAGIPENLENLDALTDYPKSLKIFSQYILIPLVLTYLIILYAYLGKILLAWDWPQGWVSKLILGFIGTGFFSMMLLHPISGRTENVWMKTASRWFFVIIIPLVVMLFFAVWRRVSEYGFTEGRYLAIALGIWLCIIIPYFIVSKKKDIKFIPASLCVALFLVSFGPWGAFAVSEHSQITRLRGLLEKNKILVDGSIQDKHGSLAIEERTQISSIISYLHEIHGFEGIQPWFAESLKKDSAGSSPVYREPASVARLMGIEYVRVWQSAAGGFVILSADRERSRDISGYDRMLRAQHLVKDSFQSLLEGDVRYRMDPGMYVMLLEVKRGGETDSVRVDFRQIVERLLKDYGMASTDRIPPEEMTVTAQAKNLKVKVNLWQIRLQRQGGETRPIAYEGDILFAAEKGRRDE
jgi:hypothetical protein